MFFAQVRIVMLRNHLLLNLVDTRAADTAQILTLNLLHRGGILAVCYQCVPLHSLRVRAELVD